MSVTKPPPSLTGASPLSTLALHFNTSIQHIQLETVLALYLRRADALLANRLLGLGAFHSALCLPMPVGVTYLAMQLLCEGQ